MAAEDDYIPGKSLNLMFTSNVVVFFVVAQYQVWGMFVCIVVC